MNEEELEKEAEEYVKKWIVEEDASALMQEAFQDGANFGYNKAKEEMQEQGVNYA